MKEKKTKKEILRIFLKTLLKARNKQITPVMAKVINCDYDVLKEIVKEEGFSLCEANVKNVSVIEIDEKGNAFNPIISCMKKNKKILLIRIDSFLKKREIDALFDLKIYGKLGVENVPSNVLILIYQEGKDFLKESVEKLSPFLREKYNFAFYDLLFV